MTFWECVQVCAGEPAFVAEFDRICGTHLSQMGSRPAIHAMIDEATGRDRAAIISFLAFVYEFVWTRIPAEGEK